MAKIAVLLYPDRVGISEIKKAGSKPSFAPPKWIYIEDAAALLEEPINFATMIRNEVGEKGSFDVYLSVWPGAYRTLLFSHTKRRQSDIDRLLRSELETVFRGGHDQLYTYHLMFNKGKYSFGGKARRMVFAIQKNHISLLLKSFAARKLHLRRIAPFCVNATEAALAHWEPAKKDLCAVIHLDDAGTTISVLNKGNIMAVRTASDGFEHVLRDYVQISHLSLNLCRQIIMNNGLHGDDDFFNNYPDLEDRVAVACDHIMTELTRTLHTISEDQPMPGQILLCGPYAKAAGLSEYLSTRMNVECTVLTAETLSPKSVERIVLDPEQLEGFFPFAMCTSSKGVDLLQNFKKDRSDLITSIIASVILVLAAAGAMSLTPIQMKTLKGNQAAAEAVLQKPEYQEVQAILDEQSAQNARRNALKDAIEALPHSATDAAGMMTQLYELTSRYGTIQELALDYEAEAITLSFTTVSYDLVVDWQKQLTADARYSFVTPPTFEGSGTNYTVTAEITSTDFTAESADTQEVQ